MLVVVDNTTSTQKQFLTKLLAYLDVIGEDYEVVRSFEELQKLPKNQISRYILSGSSQNIQDMTMYQYAMNLAAIKHGVPVLGICFGAQFLQVLYGGLLKDLGRIYCKNMNVTSSSHLKKAKFCNQYTIEKLALPLSPLAYYFIDAKRYVCMFRHATQPHIGVLFHPEDDKETHHVLEAFLKSPPPA